MDEVGVVGVVALGALALLALAATLVLRRRRRAADAADRVAARAAEERAQQLQALDAKVDRLSSELAAARAEAQSQQAGPQYVITTLAEPAPEDPRGRSRAAVPASREASRPSVALERQLVGALGRHVGVSAVRDRAVGAVVHGVALAHGVRRALSWDALDRAAAEAHVARRRSRRVRRAEIREARRLVRRVRQADGPVTLTAERPAQEPAQKSVQQPARRDVA